MKLTEIFDDIYSLAKERWQALRDGTPLFIPFPDTLSRLKKILPGLIKEDYYIVTAQTGVGKSKFIRYLFIKWPIKYVTEINSKIKLTIIYNTLEESSHEVGSGFIIDYVLEKTGQNISFYQASGFGKVSKRIEKIISEAKEKFELLEPYLEITNIGNPTGLYKKAREVATRTGKFYLDGKELSSEEVIKGTKWDKYIDDPLHYVIIIHDRLLLFSEESKNGKLMNKYQTVKYWTSNYVRQMINKKFKFIQVDIQQQIPAGESKQFTNKGDSVTEKLEPSLDKLNEVKATQQDGTVILGLFAPAKYQIEQRFHSRHPPGYDLNRMGDYYRELFILKHRKGISSKIIPLYFDGAAEIFEDLPVPGSKEMEKLYLDIKNRYKKENIKSQLTIDFNFNFDKLK